MEAAPKHLIIVDGAIMQPIPEHPKRDYIFCLSTAFGDAYLFQAPCQVRQVTHTRHTECYFVTLQLLQNHTQILVRVFIKKRLHNFNIIGRKMPEK